MEVVYLKNWKLDASNFYTFEMKNISNTHKSVIILFGSHRLITLVLKNFDEITASRKIDQQFNVPIKSTVTDVANNLNHTICLDSKHCLFTFESTRFIKYFKRNERVKAITLEAHQSGFCELSVDDNGKLMLLEYGNDAFESGEHVKSFDLSWDVKDNSFEDVQYTLLQAVVRKDNRKLIEKLLNTIPVSDLYFFSINATLNCLIHNLSDHSQYEIVCVKVFSASIRRIWLGRKGLFVLLESGVLEIFYLNKSMDMVDQTCCYFSNDILAAELVDSDTFLCLDGEQFYQIEFTQSKNGELTYIKKQTEFPGGLAFTYIKSISTCVCISHNNLFYTIKIRRNCDSPELDFGDFTNNDNYMEVDQAFIQKAENILNEMRRARTIHKEIKQTYKEVNQQFEILNVHRNRSLYTNMLTTKIRVLPWMLGAMELDKYTNFVAPKINCLFSLYADITIELDPKVINIFNKNWSVHITMTTPLSNVSYLFRIEKLTDNRASYFLPFNFNNLLSLPEFKVELVALVLCDRDLLKCSVPLKVAPLAIKETFAIQVPKLHKVHQSKPIEEIIAQFSARYSGKLKETKPTVYTINLPSRHKDTIFDNIIWSVDKLTTGDSDIRWLHFFGQPVKLEYKPTNQRLRIESKYPGAVFYVKIMVLDQLFKAIEVEDSPQNYSLPYKSLSALRGYAVTLRKREPLQIAELQWIYNDIRTVSAHFEFN